VKYYFLKILQDYPSSLGMQIDGSLSVTAAASRMSSPHHCNFGGETRRKRWWLFARATAVDSPPGTTAGAVFRRPAPQDAANSNVSEFLLPNKLLLVSSLSHLIPLKKTHPFPFELDVCICNRECMQVCCRWKFI
jgi:hypothetical protein